MKLPETIRPWSMPPAVTPGLASYLPGQQQSDGFYVFQAPIRCTMLVPCGVCWYCKQAAAK